MFSREFWRLFSFLSWLVDIRSVEFGALDLPGLDDVASICW